MENIIIVFSVYCIFLICVFITVVLLKELGFLSYLLLVTYTHPLFDRIITIIGDTFYGISLSIIGASVYSYYINGHFVYKSLLYGIIWLIFGSILKEFFKKGRSWN